MFRQIADVLDGLAPLEKQTLTWTAVTEMLNDRMRDCFRACGIGRAAVYTSLIDKHILFTVRGELKSDPKEPPPGIKLKKTAFTARLKKIQYEGDGYDLLEEILQNYELEGDGAYVWFVPDGYMASLSDVEKVWEERGGGYFSHESMCVLNTSNQPTRCRLEAFFEDETLEPVSVEFVVAPKQSLHYRIDKLKREDGSDLIPKDAPVSYKITSFNKRVVVQGSRILTSGRSSEFGSFGTAIAWTPVN